MDGNRMLYGDQLRFADARWLRRLARGFSYLGIGIFLSAVMPMRGKPLMEWVSETTTLETVMPCISIAAFFLICGGWMATQREPRQDARTPDPVIARRTSRLALIVAVTAHVVAMQWRDVLGPVAMAMHVVALFLEMMALMLLVAWVHHLHRRMSPQSLTASFIRGAICVMTYAVIVIYVTGIEIAMALGGTTLQRPSDMMVTLGSMPGVYGTLLMMGACDRMSKAIKTLLKSRDHGEDAAAGKKKV